MQSRKRFFLNKQISRLYSSLYNNSQIDNKDHKAGDNQLHELSSKEINGKKLLDYQNVLGDSLKENNAVHQMFVTNAFNAKLKDMKSDSSNKCRKFSK